MVSKLICIHCIPAAEERLSSLPGYEPSWPFNCSMPAFPLVPITILMLELF